MSNMSITVPYFRNCCFCVPLKAGLLTLGCFCLICNGLFLCLAVYISLFVTMLYAGFASEFPPFEITVLLPLVLFCEVIFYILIVVASHENNARLLKNLLIFGVALWIFTSLYCLCILYRLVKTNTYQDDQVRFAFVSTVVILESILLGYTLLLARSLKLSLGVDNSPPIVYSNLDKKVTEADLEQLLP